jgi:FixJ family two-component response regulator
MPVMSGPELFRELRRRDLRIPVIFITAREDEVVRSRLLEDGAIECLVKPFSNTALLKTLDKAVDDK